MMDQNRCQGRVDPPHTMDQIRRIGREGPLEKLTLSDARMGPCRRPAEGRQVPGTQGCHPGATAIMLHKMFVCCHEIRNP